MAKSIKRPSIPKSTQLKLWLMSGGRCEFPGCNVPLWQDRLTLRETNYSQISHIVAASPDGPRGDKTRSKLLSKSFENLMLLCPYHHKLIDSKEHEADFPEAYLIEAKKEHEKRIATLTDIKSQLVTNICFFRGLIGNQRPSLISFAQAKDAIIPHYPVSDQPIDIDLTGVTIPESQNAFEFRKRVIAARVDTLLKHNPVLSRCNHFSIFALAPIPDLIFFGFSIGDTLPCTLYQCHRETGASWKWNSEETFRESLQLKKPKTRFGNEVILKIEISGLISNDSVFCHFSKKIPMYEISAKNHGLTWLRNPNQIVEFRNSILEVVGHIRDTFGVNAKISLFPAIPAPIAIELGRCLLTKADPKLEIFDFNKETKSYYLAQEL